MIKLLLASSNKHKLEEIKHMMREGVQVFGLKDIGFMGEIPETGNTITANALIKARYAYQYNLEHKLGMDIVVSDDSGLETDALNGAPGVYSARYAGAEKNDDTNNQKLLKELKDKTDRKARFVTVIALLKDGAEETFEGEVKGTIAFEPRGTTGFGYDPLFIPRGYRSTFAELGAEVKNSISHRAMAVQKLVTFLDKLR